MGIDDEAVVARAADQGILAAAAVDDAAAGAATDQIIPVRGTGDVFDTGKRIDIGRSGLGPITRQISGTTEIKVTDRVAAQVDHDAVVYR